MQTINLLIAFSSSMEEQAEKFKQLCIERDINLQINYKVTKRGLLTDEKVQNADCLFLQEYLDVTEPITIDYLKNFDIYNNLRIVCVFSERQRADYASMLYANGFYDCIFENDANFSNLVDLFIQGRTKKEAQIYYSIKENTSLDLQTGNNIDDIENLIAFINEHKNEKKVIAQKFTDATKDYTDTQIMLLVTELPSDISEQLLHMPRFLTQYENLKSKMSFDKYEKVEKPKTIIKEKQIVSEIVKYIIPVTGAKNVGVCSLSSGAGSSFVTMNLASALADYMSVSIIEPPIYTPFLYETLGIRGYLEIEESTFYPFAHYINEDKSIENNKEFKYKNISWIVTDPNRDRIVNWNYYKMLKLMYTSKQSLLSVVDIGTYIEHDSIKNVIEQFDMLIVVIDPFITHYMNNFDILLHFKKLKESGANVEFVINKFNKGVDKKRLIEYLAIKPIEYIPFINPEYIYKSAYDCIVPYEIKEVKEILRPAFDGLIEKLVPEEILRSKDSIRNKKIFSLFNRK